MLGSPTSYLVLRCLGTDRKTPTEISEELQISLPRASMVLRDLRNLDLVRYKTRGHHKEYWLKDRMILDIQKKLEKWVVRTRSRND